MTVYVYEIWEKGASFPFYVGKTKDKDRRVKSHIYAAIHKKRTPVQKKLSTLLENHSYEFKFVAEFETEVEAFSEEKRLVKFYGRRNIKTGCLLNMTDGGEGSSGWKPSQETRELWSKQRIGKSGKRSKGYKFSKPTKRKGKPWTATQRENFENQTVEQIKQHSDRLSTSLSGRHQPLEQNKKHSEKMKGTNNPNYGKRGSWAGKTGPRLGMESPVKGKKLGPDGKMYLPIELEGKSLVTNDIGFEVLTPSGWQLFAGVALMGFKELLQVDFESGESIRVSKGHCFKTASGEYIQADALEVGQHLVGESGELVVFGISQIDENLHATYSLIEVAGGHEYITNGVVSKNCEFVSDDETLIDPLTLSTLKYSEPEFYTGQVRWFKEPEPNKTYLVGLDPCLGTGGDFSAIQVFEVPGMIQVAEWQHNKTPPRGQVKLLLQILGMLDAELREHPEQHGDPTIYWTVENNTLGEAVLQVIEDTGEHNFPGVFISEKKKPGSSRRFRKGLNTDNRKKLSACAKLKSLMESGRMKVHSRNLIRQFKNFVGNGASYSAKSGEHDDLVMSTLLTVRMLETVINWMGTEESEELKEGIDPDDSFDDPMPVIIG